MRTELRWPSRPSLRVSMSPTLTVAVPQGNSGPGQVTDPATDRSRRVAATASSVTSRTAPRRDSTRGTQAGGDADHVPDEVDGHAGHRGAFRLRGLSRSARRVGRRGGYEACGARV